MAGLNGPKELSMPAKEAAGDKAAKKVTRPNMAWAVAYTLAHDREN